MTGMDQQGQAAPPRGGLLRTVRAVAWAMFGLRNADEYRKDQHALKPLQVIAVGLAALVLFVLLLIAVVNAVV